MSTRMEKRSIQLEEVPLEPNRYWTRVVIGQEDADELPGGKGRNYISPQVCGSLTINAGTFDLQPGACSGHTELHSHSQEEFCYIISGKGWLALEYEIHHFQAGDFLFIPSFARHGWGNDEDEPARVLFFRAIKPEPPRDESPFDLRRFKVVHEG